MRGNQGTGANSRSIPGHAPQNHNDSFSSCLLQMNEDNTNNNLFLLRLWFSARFRLSGEFGGVALLCFLFTSFAANEVAFAAVSFMLRGDEA